MGHFGRQDAAFQVLGTSAFNRDMVVGRFSVMDMRRCSRVPVFDQDLGWCVGDAVSLRRVHRPVRVDVVRRPASCKCR